MHTFSININMTSLCGKKKYYEVWKLSAQKITEFCNWIDTCRLKLPFCWCISNFPHISRRWWHGWGQITAWGEPVLKSSRWLELTVLPWAMSLWVGPASLPMALPFLFSISSISLGMPIHPSCTNWVWYWNPPLTAYAHVQPLAVKTSMFSATIMIIAAEHSAKGISKSD